MLDSDKQIEMVELERKAFEAWASDAGQWPKAVERSGEGYRLMNTQLLWGAWMARAALQQPCCATCNKDAA